MKKKRLICLILLFAMLAFTACGGQESGETNIPTTNDEENNVGNIEEGEKTEEPENLTPTSTPSPTPTEAPAVQYSKITINEDVTHQTWKGFGASAAWWAQYVGAWTKQDKNSGLEMRDAIARLLYSPTEGIGLNIYRYNVGAGSKNDSGNYQSDRSTECFETAPGVYDWTKDANAVYMMKKAQEYAGEDFEAIFFCNSPLSRLTISGKAQMNKGSKNNILEENYDDFAKYVLDVAEHFKTEEGINVTEISPINEPQWEWIDGQEGCHYEPPQVVEVLKEFVNAIGKREKLEGVRISGPESGQWLGSTQSYVLAMMRDSVLKEYFDTLDIHSYWSNASDKQSFAKWVNNRFPGLNLVTSEWCEMVGGYDYGMDSALVLAKEVMDDLKILDVVSWQLWVAAAPGNYHDGLIYLNTGIKTYTET
ncbi:MAG: hypothetical protein K6B75_06185, partial [Lachnospiraceae bacterium]|nr:hypothetical protein [Lachnospiraceae bacterium]